MAVDSKPSGAKLGGWRAFQPPRFRLQKAPSKAGLKPLSMYDFVVIYINSATPDNLQCIWRGMFMDADSLAVDFDEVHPEEIEIPKRNLWLQELVVNARMQDKYGDDLDHVAGLPVQAAGRGLLVGGGTGVRHREAPQPGKTTPPGGRRERGGL